MVIMEYYSSSTLKILVPKMPPVSEKFAFATKLDPFIIMPLLKSNPLLL
jgi:hypothetical protein